MRQSQSSTPFDIHTMDHSLATLTKASVAFMILVARDQSAGSGFELLLAGGLGVCTIEALVVAHFERFPADAVEAAKARLVAHGVPLPN